MIAFNTILKPVVAAFVVLTLGYTPARAQDALELLFDQLAQPEQNGWEIIEEEIRREWAQSGSHTIDFLMLRGQQALESSDINAAIEHFTALTDHAPEYASGWSMRAQAYYAAGLYGPAIDDLYHAIALEPRHFDAMFGLVIILGEIGREDEALAFLTMLRAIHPNYPELELVEQEINTRSGAQDA